MPFEGIEKQINILLLETFTKVISIIEIGLIIKIYQNYIYKFYINKYMMHVFVYKMFHQMPHIVYY